MDYSHNDNSCNHDVQSRDVDSIYLKFIRNDLRELKNDQLATNKLLRPVLTIILICWILSAIAIVIALIR